jgi:light-regulated signal transduction histidine kinase (bacteriophytochrome)
MVDINKIIDAVKESLQLKIKESNAIIETQILPSVYADESQMTILFQNLISNSLKFSTNPPRIYISSKKEGDNFTFCIKDEGIGIESQYFERIFLIFQRLNPREQYEGTGIGLAICKRILERHDGKIWLESEPGKGTAFYFSIPKRQDKY